MKTQKIAHRQYPNARLVRSALMLTVSVALFALPTSQSRAQETFGAFRGNAQHSGFVDYALPHNLALAWQNSQPRSVGSVSAPVVDANTIYYGLGPHLYALSTLSGAIKWQYPTDTTKPINAFSSPLALDGNKLFAGNDDANLYCFNSDTGAILWQFKTSGNVHTSPVCQDGIVYCASLNQLYALDESTGKPIWPQPLTTSSPIVAAPAIGNDMLYAAGGGGRVYAWKLRTGTLQWAVQQTSTPTKSGTLVVDHGQVFILGDRAIAQLSSRMGDVRQQWITSSEVRVAPTIGDDGILYSGGTDGRITAFDNRQRAIWSTPLGDYPTAPPLLTHDLLVTATQSGVIYLLDRQTGAPIWNYTIQPVVAIGDTAPTNVPILVSPVVANGSLYILSDDGTLSAFRSNAADNSGPVVTAVYPAPDSTVSGAQIPWQIVSVDLGSGIRPDSVGLTVDDQNIPVQYDPGANMIHVKATTSGMTRSSKVAMQLTTLADGIHHAVVTAKDWRGNSLSYKWSFTADKNQPVSSIPAGPQPIAPSSISANTNATSAAAPAAMGAAGLPGGVVAAGTAAAGSSNAAGGSGAHGGGSAGAPPTAIFNSGAVATNAPPIVGGSTGGGGNGGGGGGGGGNGGGGGGVHPPPPLPPGL